MLIDLDELKIRLGIDPGDTSSDAFLTQQIEAVTSIIENYCGRYFELMVGETRHLIKPNTTVLLYRFPLVSITSITTKEGQTIDSSMYEVDETTGRLIWSGNGYQWYCSEYIDIVYDGGYDPIPYDIQEIAYDMASGRYYAQGSNPSQAVKSETVDGIGRTEYAVSNSFYGGRGGYGSFSLDQYAGALDLYRVEGVIAL